MDVVETARPTEGFHLSEVVETLIASLILPVSEVTQDEGKDLAQSALWSVDLSWSDQAKALRMAAIQNPQSFSVEYARRSISHLRVVGKEVVCVDKGTLLLPYLKELFLTGNLITAVSTSHLPSGIKVLELCYNRLNNLPCVNGRVLTHLEHLGLAYNTISHLQLTPSQWPGLLSVDLSHNSLCDLKGTVSALSTLHSLRSLMLTGNPLTLVVCYKMYVLDTLRQLICLDGSEISSSMKNEAEGTVALCMNQPDMITVCKVNFSVSELSGLPQLQTEENNEEGVIIQYMLTIGHAFLDHEAFSPVSELSDNARKVIKHISDDIYSSHQPHVFFEPTKYKTDGTICCSMTRDYTITDLSGLVALLDQGIDVFIGVSKLVYSKDDVVKEESPSIARKHLTSAKSTKSGRTSTQSGVSSVAKKPVVANSKPAKGRANQDQEKKLLEEEWKIVKAMSFKLGNKSLDMSALLELEDKRTLVISESMDLSEADKKALSHSGLMNTDNCENSANNNVLSNVSFVVTIRVEQC